MREILKTTTRIAGWSLIGLCLLILTTACGKNPNESRSNLSKHVSSEPNGPAITVENTSVECLEENCPEAMAIMLVKTGEPTLPMRKASICTAFLVHGRLLVTNAHCLPPRLRGRDVNCRDQAFFAFPRLNRNGSTLEEPEHHAECEKIVFASPIVEDHTSPDYIRIPDYALIQVREHVPRKLLPISRVGLESGVQLTAFNANPGNQTEETNRPHRAKHPSRVRAFIKKQDCTVAPDTSFLPASINKFYAVTTVSGCNFIHGNSGSPVLDSAGAVRGVVSAALSPQLTSGSRVGLLSNMACIGFPSYVTADRMPDPDQCLRHDP